MTLTNTELKKQSQRFGEIVDWMIETMNGYMDSLDRNEYEMLIEIADKIKKGEIILTNA